jgi:hypothetical protein
VTCPHCGHSAGYHQDRERTLVGLFGTIRYQRGYYYCRRCGQGLCPFDQQAGISCRGLTPAVEQLATLAGAVGDSFEKGAELLQEMAGVRLSESTVQRTTEDVGQRIEEHLKEGRLFGQPTQWDWHPDAKGRSVAYFSIDATGTRQQGKNAGQAEGRMAYVAAVYNPQPVTWLCPPGQAPPPLQARYLSGLYALDEMGPLLRRQAAHVGMEQAEVWVGLTDGGSGLEEFAQMNFNRPDLVVILDFYHAASYLEELARALHASDEEQAIEQAKRWCSLLKEEGGATTLAVLRNWQWPQRQSGALRDQRGKVDRYFENNLHRMEYPEYQAEGWQIGSGVVESACKTVVGQRLKGAGMRWGEAGAHALCHVRALYRSEKGQWQAFWQRRFTHRPSVHQPK